MKILTMMMAILIFLNVLILGDSMSTQLSLEYLKEDLRGIDLDFYDQSGYRERFIRCPSTLIRPEDPVVKEYKADMSEIFGPLNKFGIKENLLIELFMPDNDNADQWTFFTRLGIFAPSEITGKTDGDTGIISEEVTVKILYKQIRLFIANRVKRGLSPAEKGIGQLQLKNESGSIHLKIDILMQLPIDYGKNEFGILDAYIIRKNHLEAIDFCLKLIGPVQKECYRILGEAFFRVRLEKLISSGRHDIVKKYCSTIDFGSPGTAEPSLPSAGDDLINVDIRRQTYRIAAEIYLARKEYEFAIQYYKESGLKESNNRIGEIYLELKKYDKAIDFFEKGTPSPQRARAFGLLADQYQQAGEMVLAKKFYIKAILAYEWLIKSYEHICTDEDMENRRHCLRIRNSLQKTDDEIYQEQLLVKILKITARYCQRLKEELIYFYCREYIMEKRFHHTKDNHENSLVYDYQLISENKQIAESRVLLRQNGMILKEKNASLNTRFKYENLIFGPIAFFHGSNQHQFDFKILKRERFKKKETIVIEALPLFSRNTIGSMCGKIWINAIDYSVLKIEWHPKFLLRGFDQLVEEAWRESVSLKISSYMEFKKERDGIRFPSRFLVKESHVDHRGKKRKIGILDVTYKGYRFFSVGTRHRELNPET